MVCNLKPRSCRTLCHLRLWSNTSSFSAAGCTMAHLRRRDSLRAQCGPARDAARADAPEPRPRDGDVGSVAEVAGDPGARQPCSTFRPPNRSRKRRRPQAPKHEAPRKRAHTRGGAGRSPVPGTVDTAMRDTAHSLTAHTTVQCSTADAVLCSAAGESAGGGALKVDTHAVRGDNAERKARDAARKRTSRAATASRHAGEQRARAVAAARKRGARASSQRRNTAREPPRPAACVVPSHPAASSNAHVRVHEGSALAAAAASARDAARKRASRATSAARRAVEQRRAVEATRKRGVRAAAQRACAR